MGNLRRAISALAVLSLALGAHIWAAPRLSAPQTVAYACVTGSEPACEPTTTATVAKTTGAVVASVLSSAMTSSGNGAIISLTGIQSSATATPTRKHKAATHPKSSTAKKKAQAHTSTRTASRRVTTTAHHKVATRTTKKTTTHPKPATPASVPVMSAKTVTDANGLRTNSLDISSWPSDATTGVRTGTVLRHVGTINADKPGQIIDSVDVAGSINVTARGVVIRNCQVHSTTAPYGVLVYPGGSVRIEDCEFYGQREAAISGNSWTALRVNIHSQQSDGVKLGSNCWLQDSFVHDFTPSAGSHADGGQMQNGVHHLTVRHNTILMGTSKADNSALMFSPDLGPSGAGPVLVADNLLGGGGITLRIVDGNNGQFHQTGYTVSGNRFVPDAIYQEVRVGEPLHAFTGWSDNRLTRPHD